MSDTSAPVHAIYACVFDNELSCRVASQTARALYFAYAASRIRCMRSPALENVCAEVRVAYDEAHGEVCGHPSQEGVFLVHDHWHAPRQLQLNGCGR